MKTARIIRFVSMIALFSLPCILPHFAQGQIETIGPLTLVPQQPIALVFPNLLPLNPHYKELQFIGTADVPAGALSNLFVEFDYVDLNGNVIVVPAPLSTFTVFGGAPTMVDTGILTLPFCPSTVSLHLTNQAMGGIPMGVQGSFRHECFPVPEPSTVLPFLALALWHIGRRRFDS